MQTNNEYLQNILFWLLNFLKFWGLEYINNPRTSKSGGVATPLTPPGVTPMQLQSVHGGCLLAAIQRLQQKHHSVTFTLLLNNYRDKRVQRVQYIK